MTNEDREKDWRLFERLMEKLDRICQAEVEVCGPGSARDARMRLAVKDLVHSRKGQA